MTQPTTALIDGDILAYRTAAALETPIDWGDGLWTLHVHEGEARASLEAQTERTRRLVQADQVIVALSDHHNWRHAVYPEYKSNRKGSRRPMLLAQLRQHYIENYETFIRPELEADDVIGILATGGGPAKTIGKAVVCSVDKDLRTIPGTHFNFNSQEYDEVSLAEADAGFYRQALTGDATDGYPGCPGIGAKTAAKLLAMLKPDENPWPLIVQTYAKAGLSEEVALQMARCARICRAEDYDFKLRKVILWTPQAF